MAKLPIERTDFHNPGADPIVFMLGTSPNDVPEKITVHPGETYKGFKNYTKFYARNGLKPGPSPTAGKVLAEASAASAEAAKIRAAAEADKLAALEVKKEATAAKAEAELAIAEANAAKASAALVEQKDDEDEDLTRIDLPVIPAKPAKSSAKKGKGRGSKK